MMQSVKFTMYIGSRTNAMKHTNRTDFMLHVINVYRTRKEAILFYGLAGFGAARHNFHL